MNLEALGNLGDFLSGIAVVASLIYLAYQVRQNTVAVRTASRQAVVAGMREHNRMGIEPGGETFSETARTFPDVSQKDYVHFRARLDDLLLFFQGAHALWEAGTLDQEMYEAYLDHVASAISTPGGAKYWKIVREIYTSSVRKALDERIAKGGVRDLLIFEPSR
ncbi:MAG: hypothetical protein AAGF57_19820 [Pseudomonadota bacterium]